MAQQTSVEWLVEQLKERGYAGQFPPHLLFEQAKQMEREQRINAQMDMYHHINNMDYGMDYFITRDAALKYAEDYPTRLQNETN